MANPWLDLLLEDLRYVHSLFPADGALEPLLMGAVGIENRDNDNRKGRFLATDLDLMTTTGVLRVGNAPDASGDLYRAYWPTDKSIEELLDAIQREYEAIPEDGYVSERVYFGEDVEGPQLAIREALRDVNVISFIYVEGEDGQMWIRGQKGYTNSADPQP